MSKDYHSLHLTNEKTDLESASVKFKINAFLFCYMKYFTEGPRDLCACVLSCFSCLQLFVTLWTVAHQAPLWDSPGKNTGVGCHALLQGIFLTQGSNPGLLHCMLILCCLSLDIAVQSTSRVRTSKLHCTLQQLQHSHSVPGALVCGFSLTSHSCVLLH